MNPAAQLMLTAAVAAALVACGNGDTGSPQTDEVAQTPNPSQEYCSFSAELDAQDGSPSEEQLDEVEALAPPEISDDVATLVEAVREQDFENPDVAEAEERILAWEDEHCTEPQDDAGPDAEATPS